MPDVVFIPLMTAFLLLTIIPLALAGVRWWRERGIIIPTAEQTNSVSLRLDGALYDLDEESLLDARGTYDYTGKPILRARGRSRAKLEDTHRGKPGSSEPVPPSESGET